MNKKLEALQQVAEVFSTGNHLCEATEELVCNTYKLEQITANQEGYDAIRRVKSSITRYQIKGRRRTTKSWSPLDGVKPDGFDYLIAVLYNSDYSIEGYLEIPAEDFYKLAKKREDDSKPGYTLALTQPIVREYLREKPTENL